MLLLVNAPQDELVDVVSAQGLRASVGPSSREGWTTVWLDTDDWTRITDGHDYLILDESAHGWELRLVSDTHHHHVTAGAEPDDVVAIAAAMVATFGPPGAQQDVVDLLSDESSDVDDVVAGFSSTLLWPALQEPAPERAVVLHRGDLTSVRMAASIAGPALLLDVGDGWALATMAGDASGPYTALAAAISAADGRRAVTLALWRDGDASGYEVWRRGRPDSAWDWGSAWRFLPERGTDEQAHAVSSLTRALRQDIDAPLARALLRRTAPDEPLTELVDLLALPRLSLRLLADDVSAAALPAAERVERTTAPRGWLTAVRSPGQWEERPAARRLFAAMAVGTGLAAVVCAAMLVLGIAVLASDGAVHAPTATGEDRAAVALFGVLTLILVPLAVRRWRLWRTSRPAKGARPRE